MPAFEPRDPYGAALGAMRQFAQSGRFFPGEPIVVTDLAAEVGLSATPVREALACLAGEGLIERRRGRGYFYPALDASEVIDLFELQLAYLHAAVTLHPRGLAPLRKAVLALHATDGVQAVFGAIIAHSANNALTLAHQRLTHRLAAVLRAERMVEDRAAEARMIAAMIQAVVNGRADDLLQSFGAYHEQRCARVRRILAPSPGLHAVHPG